MECSFDGIRKRLAMVHNDLVDTINDRIADDLDDFEKQKFENQFNRK